MSHPEDSEASASHRAADEIAMLPPIEYGAAVNSLARLKLL
ncbi:MAG: hypothetical protein ACPIFQ_08070 [Candidatus Puniceispirillaceae bacterium]|jgi:hypothetical protein